MKHFKWKGIAFAMFFVATIMIWGIAIIPSVWATTTTVEPGAGTLETAIKNANPGDTLKLKAGSYTGLVDDLDKTVTIDKELTIEGVGNQTTVDVPLHIATSSQVSLSNFSTTVAMVEPNYIYFKVDEASAKLTLSNIVLHGILRGGEDGQLPRHDATFIDVTEKATGANITATNCSFEKPGVRYGIRVKTSETNITLDNTIIIGRTVLYYENGENNRFTAQNGSQIEGPSAIYTDTEAIVFKKQTDLTFTVDGSKVEGMIPSNNAAISVFSFEENTTGTTIDIKNGSRVVLQDSEKEDPNPESVIFGFSSNAKEADNNVAKIDATSKMYISVEDSSYKEADQKLLPITNKYSKVDGAAVVGLYDKEGKGEIKLYSEGSTIAKLSEDPYVTKEEYGDGTRFKGWFKEYNWLQEEGDPYSDEYTKQESSYPTIESGQNMDLYPKFVKLVRVKIGEDTEILESGQTLGNINEIDTKLDALKKEGQNLRGYIMHGATGGDISEVVGPDHLDDLKSIAITEDVTIEAVHTVTVKVNGEDADHSFEVETGKTIESLDEAEQEKYKNAKWNGKSEEEFSRLVYKRDGKVTEDTFTEDSPINESIELVTKHFAIVTLEKEKYKVEEEKAISTNNELTEAMNAIEQETVANKKFDRFENSESQKVTTESIIEKTTTITPIYQIHVIIGDKNCDLDEGKSLSTLDSKQEEIKGALQQLVTDAGERNFKGFVLSVTDSEEKESLPTGDGVDAEQLITTILGKSLTKNTTIYAEYNAIITIQCFDESCQSKNTFTIETGKTLEDVAKNEGENFMAAKYQKYLDSSQRDERFYHFVDEKGEEFLETTEISKSMTLTPKYFAFVTIDDERENVKGKYKVEETKTLDDLIGEDAQQALATLRSGIVAPAEELEGENLHFDKLVKVDSEGRETDYTQEEAIDSDITIRAKYHYDVSIVENYDDPQNNDEESNHMRGFKIYRNETLKSKEEIATSALNQLKSSATKADGTRKFDGYVEVNSNKEYTQDELLNKKFNTHIYINAKVAYRVKVGGKDYYIREGKTIQESDEIISALENLKQTDNKVFAEEFTVDGKEATEDEVLNTEVTKAIEINAKYKVVVNIGDSEFVIPEGGKLSDAEDQDAVHNALEALKTQVKNDGFNFNGYYYTDGDEKKDFDEEDQPTFSKNTTIGAKYNIKITIKGHRETPEDVADQYFEIDSSQTLKDIPEEKQTAYESVTKKTGRKFKNEFRNKDGEIVTEEDTFDKNEELTPIFYVTVTIKDKKCDIEEGTKLGTDEVISALEVFKTDEPEKIVHGYVYNKNKPIELTDTVEDNITIEPVYYVSLTVQYGEKQLGYYEFPENNALDDLVNLGEEFSTMKGNIEEALNNLKTSVLEDQYNFKKFVANGNEFKNTTKVVKNTTVTAQYNILVTIGKEPFEIESNGTLEDVKNQDEDAYNRVITKENRTFLHFVDENEKVVTDQDHFKKNITLTPVFAVKIKINGNDYLLKEGNTLSSDKKIMAALKEFENTKEKRVSGYKNEQGTEVTLEEAINDNMTITAEYVIDVEIVADQIYKTTVDENTTLEEALESLDYHKPDSFENFVDFETDEVVNEKDPLNKHTKLKSIYGITVLVRGQPYSLKSFQTFGELKDANDDLEKLKELPEDRVSFSRFVYVNNRGEEIELKEDTVLTTDITVIAKFNVLITIVYKNEDGTQEELIAVELEEGKAIEDLSEEELVRLNEKLREKEQQLEEAGKHSFKFSKFIAEDGTEIDMKKTIFNQPTTIEAIFEYKSESTPVGPDIEDSNKEYPIEEQAPDTGIDNITDLFQIILSMIIILITCNGIQHYEVYFNHNK